MLFKIVSVCVISKFAVFASQEIDETLSVSGLGRSLLQKSTDDAVEAASCYTCFSPGWGWSMGPIPGTPSLTYQFDMYKSNTNGCTREDSDPETLTGVTTLSVTDDDNDGYLEFHIIAQSLPSFFYEETHVYVGVAEPSSARPAPGLESSKCYSSGGSDPTCSEASGATQIHEITLDTASSTQISLNDQFYFWIHAAESETGDTVYARSNNGLSCADAGLVSLTADPVATNAPAAVPTRSPIVAPTLSPVVPEVEKNSPDHGGSCFHGDVTVMLESGTPAHLSDLVVGDRIKTSDGQGKFAFSKVLVLPHAENSEPAVFLTLTTESGKAVDMTSDHFIPKCDQAVVTAGELVVGDCVVTVDGKETLTDITQSLKSGVYTAVTKNNFIVVNGIVASPFSKNRDPDHPEQEFTKYYEELERERLRKLHSMGRKGRKRREKNNSVLSGFRRYLRG